MNKKCPKCRKQYYEHSNFCTKCGLILEKDDNRCSTLGHALCKNRIYETEEDFCEYCGALTTYAVERRKS